MSTTVVTIHKTTASEHFTILPNDLLRGRLPVPLLVMERCLLNHLLSLPEGYKITRSQLDDGFVEGEAAVTTGLRGLKRKGYLVQDKRRGTGGVWEWSWHVTDDPVNRPLTDPPGGRPGPAQPPTEPPSTEPPPVDSPPVDSPPVDSPPPADRGVVDTEPQAAPSPDSPGTAAPGPVDRDTVEGGIKEEDGDRRQGKDASPAATPPPTPAVDDGGELALVPRPDRSPPALTVNQRAKAIADDYYKREPLCQYVAVHQLVKRALGRHDDDKVRAALLRMAAAGTTVTANTLRVELDRPGTSGGRRGRSTATDRVARFAAALGDDPKVVGT